MKRATRSMTILLSVSVSLLAACDGTIDTYSTDPEGDAGVVGTSDASADMLISSGDMAMKSDAGGDMRDEDASESQGCTPQKAELQRRVGEYLETSCAHSGCHLPRGRLAPSLSGADLSELVTQGYLSPESPDTGLLRRLDPLDPMQIMPPTRTANDPADISLIRQYLEEGAPTDCLDEPPKQLAPQGNNLDQSALFTCVDPTHFAPTVWRMSGRESAVALGGNNGATLFRTSPFDSTSGPYSTFVGGEGLDSTLLSLQMSMLETSRDTRTGTRQENGKRCCYRPTELWMRALSQDDRRAIDCITRSSNAPADVSADDTCVETYSSLMLEHAALHRTPRADEVARVVTFLRDELAEEQLRLDNEGQDAQEARFETLNYAQEVSFLLFDAIFASMSGDEQGVLTPEEIKIFLNRMLSHGTTHGVNPNNIELPEQRWFDEYVRRRDAGELDSLEQRRAFISFVLSPASGFVGGEYDVGQNPARPEIRVGYTLAHRMDWRHPRRGRFWLAPRVADFLREYFGYGKAKFVAKDKAHATSVYDQPAYRAYDQSDLHERAHDESWFHHATIATQTGRDLYIHTKPVVVEPPVDEQLDDMIARAVIEAERDGGDVFKELLTSRMYRVPAWVVDGTDRRALIPGSCDFDACQQDGASCCGEFGEGYACRLDGFESGGAPIGACLKWADSWTSSGMHHIRHMGAVYGARPIYEKEETIAVSGDRDQKEIAPGLDPAHEARWVEMNTTERAGVLTHPAWLMAYGGNAEDDASAVLRGHWIREHLFCEAVGGLELVQLPAKLPASDGTVSARDRLTQTFGDLTLPMSDRTQGDSRCSNGACHDVMNSLGLPFEAYNHTGFMRFDDHGSAPNSQSTIYNWPGRSEPVEVQSAVELMEMLSEDPYARQCFLRHVFRYFAGRYETPADACVLTAMEQAFEGGSLFAAIEALYTSDAFLIRSTEQGEGQ